MVDVLFRYERDGQNVRLTLEGLTNHELHEILIGMWSRMPKDERVEMYKAMNHYLNDPGAYFSPIASAIGRAFPGEEGVIDLLELHKRGEHLRP